MKLVTVFLLVTIGICSYSGKWPGTHDLSLLSCNKSTTSEPRLLVAYGEGGFRATDIGKVRRDFRCLLLPAPSSNPTQVIPGVSYKEINQLPLRVNKCTSLLNTGHH